MSRHKRQKNKKTNQRKCVDRNPSAQSSVAVAVPPEEEIHTMDNIGEISNRQDTNGAKENPTPNIDKRKKKTRICRWLLFSVLASCAPTLLKMIFDWALEYNFSARELYYLSDLLLIICAVAANAWSYALDAGNREGCVTVAAISLTAGIGISSFFYENDKVQIPGSSNFRFFWIVAFVLLIVNAAIGVWIECRPNKGSTETSESPERN